MHVARFVEYHRGLRKASRSEKRPYYSWWTVYNSGGLVPWSLCQCSHDTGQRRVGLRRPDPWKYCLNAGGSKGRSRQEGATNQSKLVVGSVRSYNPSGKCWKGFRIWSRITMCDSIGTLCRQKKTGRRPKLSASPKRNVRLNRQKDYNRRKGRCKPKRYDYASYYNINNSCTQISQFWVSFYLSCTPTQWR
jgi:hypothetical protein